MRFFKHNKDSHDSIPTQESVVHEADSNSHKELISGYKYNKDYFESGIELGISGYSHYRWIPELTIPMCARIIEYLGIKETDRILDFGCAKGFVVKGFRLLRRNCYGYDISAYALQQAPSDVRSYLSHSLHGNYEWIISKDVFEHIPYEEIESTLCVLREHCENLFAVIPLGDGITYNVPSYESDITHVIRESLKWWKETFEKAGFGVEEATYRVEGIKDNYAHYKDGNGFFTLKNYA